MEKECVVIHVNTSYPHGSKEMFFDKKDKRFDNNVLKVRTSVMR